MTAMYEPVPVTDPSNVIGIVNRPDRNGFLQYLADEIRRCVENRIYGTIICIGIDQFDCLKGLYGLSVTDEVIMEIHSLLQEMTSEGDLVFYLGGDDFLILVSHRSSILWNAESHAECLAEKIILKCSKTFTVSDSIVPVSVNAGISYFPSLDETADSLLRKGLSALAQAKRMPVGRLKLFNQHGSEIFRTQHEMEKEIDSALFKKEFLLYFQPIVDIETGDVVSAEVLLRWYHPEKGWVSPEIFIPIAEKNSQIFDLTEFVLQQLSQQYAKWQAIGLGLEKFVFSVNFSPKQFLDSELEQKFTKFFETSSMTPRNLQLEITETTVMSDPEMTNHHINTLTIMGIKFAIDDFGTGYSSFEYLQRFKCSSIKIDKSFISDFTSNIYSRAMVESTITLGKALGLNVIAEGVETLEQYVELRKLGAHHYQGFLFSPAIPPKEFSALLS